MSRDPTLADLEAEAAHAARRVAIEQQRLYSGKGSTQRLAELQRVADGAARRLQAHRTGHREEHGLTDDLAAGGRPA